MRTLLLLTFLLAGCATTPPANSLYSPAQVRPEATIAGGVTLAQAKSRAISLRTHLTAREVVALLGLPDQTEASTYGQNTAKPWNGVQWEYKWPGRRLSILFYSSPAVRDQRIEHLEQFLKWTEENKDGFKPASPIEPSYTAEQIAARRAEVYIELEQLRGQRFRGEDYLMVNSWNWYDF